MNKIISIIIIFISTAISAGDYYTGERISRMCVGCHGDKGKPEKVTFPQLAGQSKKYLVNQLTNYKTKARKSNTMQKVTSRLTYDDIDSLAEFFSKQKNKIFLAKKKKNIEIGRDIYLNGQAGENPKPACVKCHGVNGVPVSFKIPILTLQHPIYIKRRLKHFKNLDSIRPSYGSEKLMAFVAKDLTKDEIKALADYINTMGY
jgi:cytochrome c553